MDDEVYYLRNELEALRNEYAQLRHLIRQYIRGYISHSGMVLDFAVYSIHHDMRVKSGE